MALNGIIDALGLNRVKDDTVLVQKNNKRQWKWAYRGTHDDVIDDKFRTASQWEELQNFVTQAELLKRNLYRPQ